MKIRMKRILSFVLSLAMAVSLTAGIAPISVSAATPAAGHFVYFGNWNGAPIKWRVLSASTTEFGGTGMLLMSEYTLGTTVFNASTSDGNAWEGSVAEAWCKEFQNAGASSSTSYITDGYGLSSSEAALVMTASKTEAAQTTHSLSWGACTLSGDKVFFLSAPEINTYLGAGDGGHNIAYAASVSGGQMSAGSASNWWLRSPRSSYTDNAGTVTTDGYVGRNYVTDSFGARPALVLNLSSAIFTSTGTDTWTLSTETAPGPVSGVEASATGATTAKVSWTAPTTGGAAKNFTVSYGSTSKIFTSSPAEITGLTKGTPYTFKVKANNDAGSSSEVSSNSITTWKEPGQVASLTASTTDSTGTSVKITWTPPTDTGGTNATITDYRVSADNATWDEASFDLSSRTHTFSNLTPGTSYTYYVQAKNAVGWGASRSVTIVPYGTIGPVSSLQAPAADDGKSASVSWGAPAQTGGYKSFTYDVYKNGSSVLTGTSATTYSATSLLPGEKYTFKVIPKSGSATGTESSVEVTMPNVGTISGVSHTVTETSATISWTLGSNGGSTVKGYAVTIDGKTYTAAATASSYSVSSLTPNTPYDYSVAVINGVGTGTAKASSLTTADYAKATMKSVTPTAKGTLTVEINESSSSAVTGYKLYRDGELAATLSKGQSSYVDSGLDNNKAYSYTVSTLVGTTIESVQSTAKSGTTWSLPGLVGNMRATTTKKTSVTIQWDAPTVTGGTGTVISSYDVYVNGSLVGDNIETRTYTATGLTSGADYQFDVRATNQVGTATVGAVLSVTTPTPTPVAISSVTPTAKGELTVSWTASSDTEVTGYKIYQTGVTAPVATVNSGTTSSVKVANLADNTQYGFTMETIVGATASAKSDEVKGTTWSVPDAPTITGELVSGDGKLTVEWSAPENNGGTAISGYRVYNGTTLVTTTDLANTARSYTVGSLTNGKEYTIYVAAVNAVGEGTRADKTGTPYGSIGAVTDLTATATGARTATLEWKLPSDTGGYTIDGYNVSGGGTVSVDVSNRTATISGLEPGKEYTFTVQAKSGAVVGATKTSDPITTWNVPAAPAKPTVTAGYESLKVEWTAPESNGADIDVYYVYVDGTKKATVTATATSTTISDLAAGQPYSVTVSAHNSVGEGSQSEAATGTPYTVPGAPKNVTASATGANTATVEWEAPDSNGYESIDNYYVYIGSDLKATVDGDVLTANITGLVKGTEYTFTVKAKNAADYGAGTNSKPITTWKEPDAPGSVNAEVVSSTTAKITWSLPNNNGADIEKFIITGGEETVEVTGAAVTEKEISGLTPGETYTFSVYAHNSVGDGEATEAKPITMSDVPDAPTVTATATGGTTAKVEWTVPEENGSAIEKYVITGGTSPVEITDPGTTSTEISGLTPGEEYTFSVVVHNGVGASAAGMAEPVTTWNVPDKPGSVTATVTSGSSVKVTWTLPANNGSAIDKFIITGGEETVEVLGAAVTEKEISGLTPGETYTFSVYAHNSVGDGEATEAEPITMWNVPDKPEDVTVTPGDKMLTVSWTAPESNGAAIDEYYVYVDGEKKATVDAPATSAEIGGLINGTEYEITVSAHNSVGEGEQSEVKRGTPRTVPGAPVLTEVIEGDKSLTVAWDEPADNGGNAVSSYTVYVDGEPEKEGIKETSYEIGGLTNGKAYSVSVAAVNEAGTGEKSNVLSGTPKTVPGKPEITEIKAGNKQAFISIGAPEEDGGAEITGYNIYVDGILNSSVSVREVEDVAINNLTNNVSYTITVAAVNSAGPGEFSDGKTVKVGMPRPPENIAVAPGNCEFEVSWDKAESNGTVITGYNIYVNGVLTKEVESIVLSTKVDGLINGMVYRVQVSTVSSAGESLLSDEHSVYVGGPTAPVIESVTADDEAVTVTWSESESHGMLMRNYKVYVNGVETTTTDAAVRTAELTDLTKGESYSIQVSGVNIAGEGAKSAAYTIVFGAPNAPTDVSAVGSDSTLTVTWSAPGSDVTGYVVYINGEKKAEPTATDREAVISGLANGISYKVEVAAVNGYGEGAKSAPVYASPFTYSHAPTNVVAKATGKDSATITWKAPINNGGMPVSGYEIGGYPAGATCVVTGNEATITGLSPDTEYTFTVAAVNGYGEGASPNVASSNTIRTWTTPSAPVDMVVESGDGSASVTWKAPASDGGSEVTSYNVYVDGVKNNKTPITATSYSVANLRNGKYYSFTVAAVNAVDVGATAPEQRICIGIPTIPTITGVVAGDESATITWIRSTENTYDITGYKVYVDGEPYEVVGDGTEHTVTGLTNGQTYTIALTAMCGVDETAMSNSVTVTPGTLAAPLNVTAEADNASIRLSWNAVEGATGYIVYLDGEAQPLVDGIETVLGGLSNREYEVAVATSNTYGAGSKSSAIKVTPWTVPDAPEITSIVPTRDGFTVTYTEPAANGKEITGYEIYVGEELLAETAELSATVGGFSSGDICVVTVKARSSAGASAASASAEVAVGAPGETQITRVDIGMGELTVHYTEAAQNGAAITGYNIYAEVVMQDGIVTYANIPITATSTGTSATVSGLTDGVTYAITVEAVNSIGAGPLSDPYYAVPGAPGSPIMSSANAGDASVTLVWKEPLDNADAVVKYLIYIDGEFYAEATSLTANVTGLENGKEYAFSVSAVNENGESAQSEPMTATPCTVPEAPQEIKAVASGEDTVILTWLEPAFNGGSPVTGYVVGGEGTITMSEDELSATVTGLEAGETYVFTVMAVNSEGDGAVGTSNEVVALTVPGKPSILMLEPGNGIVIVSEWEAPEDNGGTDILGYNVYYKEGKLGELVKANGDTLVTEAPYVVTGLTNGAAYYLYIAAVNDIGESEKSAAVGAKPSGSALVEAPDAPRNFNAVAGDRSAYLTWDAPLFNGNSEILGYYVYLDGGKLNQTPITDTFYEVSGLRNGTAYTVGVKAANIAGDSEMTDEITVTPVEPAEERAPGAVADGTFTFTVDAAKENAILTWEAPSDLGTGEFLGYNIYNYNELYNTDEYVEATELVFPVDFEATYYISVAAVNDVGEGPHTRNIVVKYNLNIDSDGDGDPDFNIDTNNDGTPDENIDLNLNGVLDSEEEPGGDDDDDKGGDEGASQAPAITGAVSNGLNTITVKWSAPEDAEEAAVTGYNVYVNDDVKYVEGADVLSYDITGADTSTSYVVYVTAVNEAGESARSDKWTAKLLLNLDTTGDGDPDSALDTNGNGIEDSAEDVTYTVSGSVVFSGTSYLADVKLVNDYGIVLGEAKVANGGTFEFEITVPAGTTIDETYSVNVSGKYATATTVTGITITDDSVNLGEVTIYAGDVTGDGYVTSRDLSAVQDVVGTSGSDVQADVTGDGYVTSRDLSTVQDAIGERNATITWK